MLKQVMDVREKRAWLYSIFQPSLKAEIFYFYKEKVLLHSVSSESSLGTHRPIIVYPLPFKKEILLKKQNA